MNIKHIVTVSLVSLISTAAMADGGDIGTSNYPVRGTSLYSRSSVKADVIYARASGELREAGEVGDIPFTPPSTASALSRQEVKLATLNAAKAGQLTPAGEGDSVRPSGESTTHAVGGSARKVAAGIAGKSL